MSQWEKFFPKGFHELLTKKNKQRFCTVTRGKLGANLNQI